METANPKNLELFLTFAKGDHRCSPQNSPKYKKIEIPGSELDFPLIRYLFSLQNRIAMLSELQQKIIEFNSKANEEMSSIHQGQMISDRKGIILVLYYESFISQIFNIFENIAKVNLFFFFEEGRQIPQDFSKQLEKSAKKKPFFSPCYDPILKEMKSWYSEAVGIRHNSCHFMVGFDVYSKNDQGGWNPQYMNYNVIDRKNPKPIEIKRDILKDTVNYHEKTISSLNRMAGCYIERMDKDVPCDISFSDGKSLEIRRLTYNQFISGNLGLKLFPYQK